jgi:hypothetical protein
LFGYLQDVVLVAEIKDESTHTCNFKIAGDAIASRLAREHGLTISAIVFIKVLLAHKAFLVYLITFYIG